MSAPTSTMLIVAPDSTRSRLVGNQAPPVMSGVRVIVITVSDRIPERIYGVELDTVIVMDGCRPAGAFEFWQRIRAMHRGNGPWIELDLDFVGVKP